MLVPPVFQRPLSQDPADDLNGRVYLCRGNGDGTFQPPQVVATYEGAICPRLADLDHDGDLDMVSIDFINNKIVVFRNTGLNTFTTLAEYDTFSQPLEFTIADFNDDTNPDIALVRNSDSPWIMFNSGTGTFPEIAEVGTLTNADIGGPADAADVDMDGNIDLALSYAGRHTVLVARNDGEGAFAPPSLSPPIAVGQYPIDLVVEDIDGDAALDAVVANRDSETVSVVFNVGDDLNRHSLNFAVGDQPTRVAIADVDQDGDPDLICLSYASKTVSVLRNDSAGSFVRADYAVDARPVGLAVADFDGDGYADIAVPTNISGMTALLYNSGDGTFLRGTDLPKVGSVSPNGIVAADYDADGNPDLIITGLSSIVIWRNLGNRSFGQCCTIGGMGFVLGISAADLDSDGDFDLLVVNNQLQLFVILSNGDGTFQPPGGYALPYDYNFGRIYTGDLNGDGVLDVVEAGTRAGHIGLYRGRGGGVLFPKDWNM